MVYYVETEFVQIAMGQRFTRTMLYNFKKQCFQVKMTNSCVTKDRNMAEAIYSTRKLINPNTHLKMLVE